MFHIRSLNKSISAERCGVEFVDSLIYTEVQILIALLTASMPAINGWLRRFNTGVGGDWTIASSSGSTRYGISPNYLQIAAETWALRTLGSMERPLYAQGNGISHDSAFFFQAGGSHPQTDHDARNIYKKQTWEIRFEDRAFRTPTLFPDF